MHLLTFMVPTAHKGERLLGTIYTYKLYSVCATVKDTALGQFNLGGGELENRQWPVHLTWLK